MTTLRKLPTIAPMAKAKTLSRLKVASYAIAGTRGNVTTRAYLDGGEWGLVASAVFKTVVSARKRRRVGSIPTRLRQFEPGKTGAECEVLSAESLRIRLPFLSTQHSALSTFPVESAPN